MLQVEWEKKTGHKGAIKYNSPSATESGDTAPFGRFNSSNIT